MVLIAATLLTPLAGALLLALLRFQSNRVRAWFVELFVLAASALAGILCLRGEGSALALIDLGAGLRLGFHVDGFSRVFTALAAFLWPLATLYAFEYMAHEKRENAFFVWYVLCYTVTLAVALAENLFSLIVFLELLTLTTLPLVRFQHNRAASRAGWEYLAYLLGGAALAVFGMVMLLRLGAGLEFTPGGALGEAAQTRGPLLLAVFAAMLLGFATKAALFPVHAWLPVATVAPTPATALLSEVAVVNAGVYACIRLIYCVFGADFLRGTWGQGALLALAAFTVFYGAVMAARERHLKRRLAYSTMANLGYILLGAALMTPAGLTGALTHMVCHGLMKITLFCCAGAMMAHTGCEYADELGGQGRAMPFTFAAWTLAGLALMGVPPLAGFVSKWNLLAASAEAGGWLGGTAMAALLFSAVLTAYYTLGVTVTAFFKPQGGEAGGAALEKHDPHWRMRLSLSVLSAAILAAGFFGEKLTEWLSRVAAGLIG